MKAPENFFIWTDYPFNEFGDVPFEEAPFREVRLVSYDGDKYCRVEFMEKCVEVKAGYLYYSPRVNNEAEKISKETLLRFLTK
jgi:hypothetical protein